MTIRVWEHDFLTRSDPEGRILGLPIVKVLDKGVYKVGMRMRIVFIKRNTQVGNWSMVRRSLQAKEHC